MAYDPREINADRKYYSSGQKSLFTQSPPDHRGRRPGRGLPARKAPINPLDADGKYYRETPQIPQSPAAVPAGVSLVIKTTQDLVTVARQAVSFAKLGSTVTIVVPQALEQHIHMQLNLAAARRMISREQLAAIRFTVLPDVKVTPPPLSFPPAQPKPAEVSLQPISPPASENAAAVEGKTVRTKQGTCEGEDGTKVDYYQQITRYPDGTIRGGETDFEINGQPSSKKEALVKIEEMGCAPAEQSAEPSPAPAPQVPEDEGDDL